MDETKKIFDEGYQKALNDVLAEFRPLAGMEESFAVRLGISECIRIVEFMKDGTHDDRIEAIGYRKGKMDALQQITDCVRSSTGWATFDLMLKDFDKLIKENE